ncbi:MAG: hypothetical protein EYC70_09360 [Planctomycetota bacterium]|nr:MAG: hypothetical protein EYC70_09360 [Planctomycetota bacterium]
MNELLLLLPSLLAAPSAQDFNGDGYSDLAVGVFGENISGAAASGAVQVLYGGPSGLGSAGAQFLCQNSAGVRDMAEQNDSFGLALQHGDFDGDGFDDLAVGSPREAIAGLAEAGLVQVFYGGALGLTTTGQEYLTQKTPGAPGALQSMAKFGAALAAGDVDEDGCDELAIGIPGADWGGAGYVGSVWVLAGSAAGLQPLDSSKWSRATFGQAAQSGAGFGSTLVMADFDGNGHADLAIGAPGTDVGAGSSAGAVHVVYSSSIVGLTSVGASFWHQDVPGIDSAPTNIEKFGAALAAGDFDGNGRDDLAIGVPYDFIAGSASPGAVHVLYGLPAGLGVADDEYWHEDVPGVYDVAESQDQFGAALAAGNFDGDAYADLAIGVPGEGSGEFYDLHGAVHVFMGSVDGLSNFEKSYWTQDDTVQETSEVFDMFGQALAVGDFNDSGYDDLAIGAPGEYLGAYPGTAYAAMGVVHVFYAGIPSASSDYWHQNVAGIPDLSEHGDFFGWSLGR